MNEVKVSGKVLNCFISENSGALVVKIAVSHEHIMGKYSDHIESVFKVFMIDERKIPAVDVMTGDTVMVTGYLKVDHTISPRGNDHQALKVYATDIEVIRRRK